MKKRVLALLLTLLMLGSAVPTLLLSVSAADTEKEYDYSSLYVTDGAIVVMDFFETNSIWNPDGIAAEDTLATPPLYGESYTDINDRMDFWIVDKDGNIIGEEDMPLAEARAELVRLRLTDPQNEKGYVLKEAYDSDYYDEVIANTAERVRFWITSPLGVLEDENGTVYFHTLEEALDAAKENSTPDNTYSVTSSTVGFVPEYNKLVNNYTKSVDAWLQKHTVTGTTPSWTFPGVAYDLGQTWRDATGEFGFATFDQLPGAIRFNPYAHSDAYLNLGGKNLAADATVTAQYVMLPGHDFGKRTFMVRNVALATEAIYSADGNQLLFTGIEEYGSVKKSEFPAYGTAGAITIPLDNETPMDVTIAVKHSAKATDANGKLEFFYNGESAFTADVSYTANIPANPLTLLNFGANISSSYFAIRLYSRALTEDEMIQNHFADIAKWYKLDIGAIIALSPDKKLTIAKEFVDDVIGGGLAEREVLAAKLKEIVDVYVYGALSEGIAQPSAACLSFAALAKELSADISGVLMLEPAARETVYSVVNALPATQKLNRTIVQETIDLAVEAVLDEIYGAYAPKTTITYKDLYARQDQLVTWVDFFAATPDDGDLYMDYSYPEETWNLPHTVNGEWNPQKLRTPEISGEQAARDKYVFSGGDKFQFGDIPDAGWGHSNVRTWGDGRLICGKNNVLRVKSANLEGSLTYQVVMDWCEGEPNFQLDTFRIYFPHFSSMSPNRAAYIKAYQYKTFMGVYGPREDQDYYTAYSGPSVTFSTALNITLTVDKEKGTNDPRYYLVEPQTNEDGGVRYENSRVAGMSAVRADNYVYRTEIDGEVYYLAKTAGDAAATYGPYVVVMTENYQGRAQYITANDNGTTAYGFYAIVDGVVDKTPIAFKGVPYTKPSLLVDTELKGPLYVNPPREVSKNADGDVREIFDDGIMDIRAYMNGTKVFDVERLSVNGGDIGWLGNGSNPTFFAIRTYSCVLTEEEMLQNHFADLAGYYGFNLVKFSYLTEEQKTTLFEALKSIELGGDRAAAVALYDSVVDGFLYDFGSDTEAADTFGILCRTYALDAGAVYALSPESRARVFEAFASYSLNVTYAQPVLQKALLDAVALEYRDHYTMAVGHGAIDFVGWQLHLEGDLGLRALFATDLDLARDLSARGTVVKTGLLMAEDGDTTTADDLKALIDTATGEIDLDAASDITLVKGYWENGAADGTFVEDGDLYFTKDVFIEDDYDAYMVTYVYVGFAILEDENGDVTVFFADTTRGATNPGSAQSLLDLTETARIDYGMAYPNIQRVLNEVEGGDPYVSIFVGSTALTDLRLVIAEDTFAMSDLQTVLLQRIAVALRTVSSANADPFNGGYVVLAPSTSGGYNNVYGDGCYGIIAENGTLYLWYNEGATASDVVEYFSEIVNYYADQEMDILFTEGEHYVRRVGQ